MRQSPCLFISVISATLMVISGAVDNASALIIQNVTTGKTLFNAVGYELDRAGQPATYGGLGYWSNASVTYDRTGSGGNPGQHEGSNYLTSTRDATGAGNPRAFLTTPASTSGDVIHAEWMMYMENPSDNGFFFTNASGTNIGQMRIGGQGLGTVQDSWTGTTTSNVYTAQTWQKWELDYTIGATTYALTVNNGTPITGSINGGSSASTGLSYLSFYHNGNQNFHLDSVVTSTLGNIQPQPLSQINQMIDIDWRFGPKTPKGLQDNGIGILEGTLVTAGGYGNTSSPGGGGFRTETWGLNPPTTGDTWATLPSLPGPARQGMGSVVLNDDLYVFGGFNYSSPYVYSEGYQLSKSGSTWSWTTMPSLPTARTNPGLAAVGTKIYAIGGADYDSTKFCSETNCAGTITDFGAKVYVLDTTNLGAGWTALPDMPGTARWSHAVTAVGDKIYVIGGAAFDTTTSATVVDNWVYDTTTSTWERIRDLPATSGNFDGGQIVVDGRYILLVGGYTYGQIENPDGTIRSDYPSGYDSASSHYPSSGLYKDIWVYDTQTNLFGTATDLPLDNNLAKIAYGNGKLHVIGGETGNIVVPHHPDLHLIGDITVLTNPEPASAALLVAGVAVLLRREANS